MLAGSRCLVEIQCQPLRGGEWSTLSVLTITGTLANLKCLSQAALAQRLTANARALICTTVVTSTSRGGRLSDFHAYRHARFESVEQTRIHAGVIAQWTGVTTSSMDMNTFSAENVQTCRITVDQICIQMDNVAPSMALIRRLVLTDVQWTFDLRIRSYLSCLRITMGNTKTWWVPIRSTIRTGDLVAESLCTARVCSFSATFCAYARWS